MVVNIWGGEMVVGVVWTCCDWLVHVVDGVWACCDWLVHVVGGVAVAMSRETVKWMELWASHFDVRCVARPL